MTRIIEVWSPVNTLFLSDSLKSDFSSSALEVIPLQFHWMMDIIYV